MIELRESSNIALAMIMADLAEGKIENGIFTIYCKKEDEAFLNNNKKIFEDAFFNLAEDLKFQAQGIEEKKVGEKEFKLKKFFKDKLKIE